MFIYQRTDHRPQAGDLCTLSSITLKTIALVASCSGSNIVNSRLSGIDISTRIYHKSFSEFAYLFSQHNGSKTSQTM